MNTASFLASQRPSQDKVLTAWDKISSYIVTSGACASLGAGLIAGLYYGSPWLMGLMAAPGAGCAVGYCFILRYRKLKTLNTLSEEVTQDAQRITISAATIDSVAQKGLGLSRNLSEMEEKMGTEFADMRSGEERRQKEVNQLNQRVDSLKELNQNLTLDNARLKSQIDQLQNDLQTLSRQIGQFQQQNNNFYHSVQAMGVNVGHFERNERALSVVSDHLGKDVEELTSILQEAQIHSETLFNEVKQQNEELRKKLDEFNANIAHFEEVKRDLTLKLAEKQRLAKRIAEETLKLDLLHERVLAETAALRAMQFERRQPKSPSNHKDLKPDG